MFDGWLGEGVAWVYDLVVDNNAYVLAGDLVGDDGGVIFAEEG